MKKELLLTVLLMCSILLGHAQNIDEIVKRAAAPFLVEGSKAGLSVGVIKNGKLYSYHFGNTDFTKSSPPVDESIYEIGSITKSFTSTLLAQAVIDKKVNLNDDIRKYLRGSYPNLEYKGKPIRLIHLANLTSGLPDNLPEKLPAFKSTDQASLFVELKKIHDGYTRTQFLKDLHQVKLKVAAGTKSAHSNTAAQLMGFLLENIYGMNYTDLLKKYITGPLKMESTFLNVPSALQSRVVNGYNDQGVLMPGIPKDAGSGGGLKSNITDMIKYISYHLNEKEERLQLSHQLTWGNTDEIGLGLNWWLKTNFDGKRKVWTSGGTFGFCSYGVLYPERSFALVLLSNQNYNGAESRLSGVAQSIYNDLFFSEQERSSEGFGFSASVNSLVKLLNQHGFEQAIQLSSDLKKKDPSFKLKEAELNEFGYHFIGKNEKNKALEIFKLNVSLFPQSSNTYDSLAEIYELIGDKEEAIKNYKRALELDPSNSNAAGHLKKLGDK